MTAAAPSSDRSLFPAWGRALLGLLLVFSVLRLPLLGWVLLDTPLTDLLLGRIQKAQLSGFEPDLLMQLFEVYLWAEPLLAAGLGIGLAILQAGLLLRLFARRSHADAAPGSPDEANGTRSMLLRSLWASLASFALLITLSGALRLLRSPASLAGAGSFWPWFGFQNLDLLPLALPLLYYSRLPIRLPSYTLILLALAISRSPAWLSMAMLELGSSDPVLQIELWIGERMPWWLGHHAPHHLLESLAWIPVPLVLAWLTQRKAG
jgi:hypothetical protein